MRKILLAIAPLSLAASLAACSSESADEAAADNAIVEEPAPATVANGSAAGTYAATAPDGSVTVTTVNEDGTYTDADTDGNITAEGTWAVTDGKTCFSPTTEGATPMCYTESAPAEDGSFTATPDEGDPLTVAPYVAPTEDAPAE